MKKQHVIAVVGAVFVLLGGQANNAKSSVNGYSFGSASIGIGITNDYGEILDEVRICTGLENSSDITIAYFLDFWNKFEFADDWDSDGIPEICYRFTSPGGAQDMDPNDSGNVVFLTAPHINPQAMANSNGTQTAPAMVVGPFIHGTDGDFTVPTPNPYSTLTVTSNNGNVSGTGIDCGNGGPDCTASKYWGDGNTLLTATPNIGHEFTSWTNCPNENADECTWGDGSVAIAANSSPFRNYLTVNVSGAGGVTSTPAGIDTSSAADTAQYHYGDTITLTATPDTGHRVRAWSGCDNPSAAQCLQTLNQNSQDGSETVSVEFEPLTYALAVSLNEPWGEVSGAITCLSGTCSTQLTDGAYTLTVTADQGYSANPAGCDTTRTLDTQTQECDVELAGEDRIINVAFEKNPSTLLLYMTSILSHLERADQ